MLVKPTKPGEFLHPREHDVLIFTDTSNKCWGTHLDQGSRGGLWTREKKKATHKPHKTECSNPSLPVFQKPVQRDTTPDGFRQHHCGSPHKQTEGNSLSRALHSYVETSYLVPQTPDNTQSKTCSRLLNVILDGLQRRIQIQHTEWSLSLEIFKQLWECPDRPGCDQFKHQTSNLCVTHSRRTENPLISSAFPPRPHFCPEWCKNSNLNPACSS